MKDDFVLLLIAQCVKGVHKAYKAEAHFVSNGGFIGLLTDLNFAVVLRIGIFSLNLALCC